MKKKISILMMFVIIYLITACTADVEIRVSINEDRTADLEYTILSAPDSILNELSEEARDNGFNVTNLLQKDKNGIKAKKEIEDINEIPSILASLMGMQRLMESEDMLKIDKGWFENTYTFNKSFDLQDLNGESISTRFTNQQLKNINFKFIIDMPTDSEIHNAAEVFNEGRTMEWHVLPEQYNAIQAQFTILNTRNVIVTVIAGIGAVIILLMWWKRNEEKDIIKE